MHQHGYARSGQGQGGEQEPGGAASAAGSVRWPVEVYGQIGPPEPIQPWGGPDHAGDFLGVLAAEAQQHQEGTDLMGIGFAAQDHAEGSLGLVAGEGTRTSWASAQGGDEGGELGCCRLAHYGLYRRIRWPSHAR